MIGDFVDNYTIVIIAATVGFFLLAAILLVPVYRFLLKEEKHAEKWTSDSIAENVERRLSKSAGETDNRSERDSGS